MTNFFLYCINKNEFFRLTEGYPPRLVSLNYEKKLPRTQKNVQSAGFHTCFRYGNLVIPMVFALALFMHSKILPQIFLPQIF